MDSADYLADLEEEARTLRRRVLELEEELRESREDLRVALERKVEETNEGIPPEEIAHRNRPKKEETPGSGLSAGAVKSEVKAENRHEINPEKSDPIRDAILSPASRGSTVPPQREPSPIHPDEDDVVMVDPPQQSPDKRKAGRDQPSPRPTKRQTFWVEVPPHPKRKRVPSAPVKQEPSTPEDTIVPATAPGVKEEPDQEMANALAVIRNTSLKKDKKALDDVTVFTRLSKIGLEIFPITIEDEIKEFSVSRVKFLSTYFGGSSVDTFPSIKQDRVQKHGFDKFMCINLVLHPDAPSLPGAPGLWMDCGDSGWSGEDMRLIVRVKATSPTLWQYMGQYDVQPSDPLSLQEWTMQSEQTKKAWVKYIHQKNWGGVRARIELRMGAQGSEEVSEAQVREAFDEGEEQLSTWSMKCRGYDERFQREIFKAASTQNKEG